MNQHACRCTADVLFQPPRAIAVYTEAPPVRMRLEQALEPAGDGSGVFIARGDDLPELFSMLLEPLSERERASIRAVEVREDGTFDPWNSGPIAAVLGRIDTA